MAADIYAVRLGVDSVAVPLEVTEFQERSVSLSPNDRWLAYVSNRSGRDEVYVRPFPDAGASLQQVSTDGGIEPLWAHSGRELFYRNGANELVAVEITDDPTFAAGQQHVLFSMASYLTSNGRPQYDVSADDQRFVMLRIMDQGDQLILVDNWFEELKERAELTRQVPARHRPRRVAFDIDGERRKYVTIYRTRIRMQECHLRRLVAGSVRNRIRTVAAASSVPSPSSS